MHRTSDPARRDRKEKKSYTLSSESVNFLEGLRKARHSPSTSSVLEEIVQAARREQEKAAIDRQIVEYYDSLSGAERKEHAEWAEVAWRNFPKGD